MKKKIFALIVLAIIIFTGTDSLMAQGGYVDFTSAAEKSVHAVVHIKTEFARKNNLYDYYFDLFDLRDLFNYQQRNAAPIIATGSGVLISQDGYIVTNNHVVQDALKVEVTLNDKRSYTAEIIGTDPSSDFALLKIDASGLPYLTYENSEECKIGECILAVGNPLNLTS
ncbi:MAG: trypsin-like peptidase domain-containing protein, partial [Bacteroidales bacterium]|nr:trypsin-like peptidase domain-containing protein [Bacteroidales bacterium]